MSFATDWRKRVACVTCRKNKIRCEFTSPEAPACKSCLRKGISCVMASSQRFDESSSKPKRKPATTKYAWLGNRHVSTVKEKEEKIKQLEKVINDAKNEITKLKGESPADTDDSESASMSPAEWSPDVLQRLNCVQSAMDTGLLTQEMADYYYRDYLNTMRFFLPVSLPDERTLEESSRVAPLTTLAAITSAMAVSDSPPPKLDPLIIFLERTASERVFLRSSQGPDVVNALCIASVYLQPTPQPKISNHVVMALACSVSLDLGSDDDVKRFEIDPTDEEAHDRLNAYQALFLCSLAMTSLEGRPILQALLPKKSSPFDALFKYGNQADKYTACCVRLYQAYISALSQLKATRHQPIAVIRQTLNEQFAQINACSTETARISDGFFGQEAIRKPYKSNEASMIISLSEMALNHMMFNDCERAELADIRELGIDIVDRAQTVINSYLDISMVNPKAPQWVYLRPLEGITALLRTRMLFWTMGIQYDTAVVAYYKKIVEGWKRTRTTRHISDKLIMMLQTIDRWMSIRMHYSPSDDIMVPTSSLWHLYLRDVIVGNTSEGMKQKLESGVSDRHLVETSQLIEVGQPSSGQVPDLQPQIPQIPLIQDPVQNTPLQFLSDNPDSLDWQETFQSVDIEQPNPTVDTDELLRQLFSDRPI